MEECHQEDWNVSNKFGTITLCLATYFLKVDARFSLKVVTKASLRGRKILKIYTFRVLF